jgi:hypothetical protein
MESFAETIKAANEYQAENQRLKARVTRLEEALTMLLGPFPFGSVQEGIARDFARMVLAENP